MLKKRRSIKMMSKYLSTNEPVDARLKCAEQDTTVAADKSPTHQKDKELIEHLDTWMDACTTTANVKEVSEDLVNRHLGPFILEPYILPVQPYVG